jgi:tRNA-specific 2-thiouridylase
MSAWGTAPGPNCESTLVTPNSAFRIPHSALRLTMSLVVLAMSGGVDSSVAAHLLQQDGHDVIGVFMRHGDDTRDVCRTENGGGGELPVLNARADHKQGCCSASDAADARRVADRLEIPFYALNLQAEFREIIDYFVAEYTGGRTPNPCVMCNNWIKFGRLFRYADSVSADFVATGHYARLESTTGHPTLVRGIDESKDQSYVLFGIERSCLDRMLLPVGTYRKSAIRDMAQGLGLRVADKRDSQEICFVTSGNHAEFVAERCSRDTSGEIVTTDGEVVGHHPGIEGFTIGQRKGLGVAFGEPRFVVRIEPECNRVVIGGRCDLERWTLTANRTNWLTIPPSGDFRCTAQIRYNSPAAPATARVLPGERLEVVFDSPRHGVAPGQAVVCYDGGRVLGGGWIC